MHSSTILLMIKNTRDHYSQSSLITIYHKQNSSRSQPRWEQIARTPVTMFVICLQLQLIAINVHVFLSCSVYAKLPPCKQRQAKSWSKFANESKKISVVKNSSSTELAGSPSKRLTVKILIKICFAIIDSSKIFLLWYNKIVFQLNLLKESMINKQNLDQNSPLSAVY